MKRAIIIGASSGIGFEIARLLLSDGWQIGIAARRRNLLLGLKALKPDMVHVETIDVNEADSHQRLARLIDAVGGMDLFVCASGIGKQNVSLDKETEINTVETNCMGFTRMVTTAYNYFSEQDHGHIVVISSIAGTKGLGVAPSYSASKAFQNTYIQALEQLAKINNRNIRFTDIRPGFVDTALLNDSKHYPMMMSPQKVAKTIVESIYRKRHTVVIDWKWKAIVMIWKLIPDFIWRNIKPTTK